MFHIKTPTKRIALITGFTTLALLMLLCSIGSKCRGGLHSMSLADLWWYYRHQFISPVGQVIDGNGQLTTSEGQSYAMLRAVWVDDPGTFDTVWQWTQQHLQNPKTHLFAWKYGPKSSGHQSILDTNPASDADQDIALSLLLAAHRWDNPTYKTAALKIIDGIWTHETLPIPGQVPQSLPSKLRVFLPGPWAKKSAENTIPWNPSYGAPYAFRIFGEVDPHHPWVEVLDGHYYLLKGLQKEGGSPLYDWATIDNKTGRVIPDPLPRGDFGFESIRIPWRLAVDHLLVPKDSRSKTLWQAPPNWELYWKSHGQLPGPLKGNIHHPISRSVNATLLLTGNIGAPLSRPLVIRYLDSLLHPMSRWNTPKDYYTQNWLWFTKGISEGSTHCPIKTQSIPENGLLNRLLQCLSPSTPKP